MKLRNKKTGEIGEAYWATFREDGTDLCISMHRNGVYVEVNSLAELNEEWEDYKPTEPLIKDEKIRKAVRAWAEANDVEKVDYWNSDYKFQDMQGGSSINFEDNPIETEGRYGNDEYTITELCGEDEAPEPIEPTFIDLDERINGKEE